MSFVSKYSNAPKLYNATVTSASFSTKLPKSFELIFRSTVSIVKFSLSNLIFLINAMFRLSTLSNPNLITSGSTTPITFISTTCCTNVNAFLIKLSDTIE